MTNRKPEPPSPAPDSLSVELGNWFKANATGRGVFVIGGILLGLAAFGFARLWFALGG